MYDTSLLLLKQHKDYFVDFSLLFFPKHTIITTTPNCSTTCYTPAQRSSPEHKSSLLWNFNFKFHMHVGGGHRQKPIDFQWRHFQNGRLAAILDCFVSRLELYFGFEYQLQTSGAHYLCIWEEAYWCSATSFSKWPPGGHIGFFVSRLCRWHGFRSVSQVCFGISISNFICVLTVVIGSSLLTFSYVIFKMAT